MHIWLSYQTNFPIYHKTWYISKNIGRWDFVFFVRSNKIVNRNNMAVSRDSFDQSDFNRWLYVGHQTGDNWTVTIKKPNVSDITFFHIITGISFAYRPSSFGHYCSYIENTHSVIIQPNNFISDQCPVNPENDLSNSIHWSQQKQC